MKLISIFLSLFFLFPKPYFLPQESGGGKREIVIEKEEVYPKDVISFGGDVTVRGVAKKSVIVIGGSISIYGTVHEDVFGIGSKVAVFSGAKIDGDLIVIGGKLRKDRATCIEGDMFYFKPSRNFPALFKSAIKSATAFPLKTHEIFLKIISLLSWFIIVVIVLAIFPRNISRASLLMSSNMGRSFLIGLLFLVVILVFFAFFSFLSLFLIGVPFLAFILIGLFVTLIFGRTVIFHWLGSILLKSFKRYEFSNMIAIVVGFMIFFVLSFLPFLSIIARIFVDIAGIGIVIITRFGTREE